MDVGWLNILMSVSELGVVTGVILEGTEYVPTIHQRWPILEKVGFFILILSLVGDWHFQSAINQQQTEALIAANSRIATLLPRSLALYSDSDEIAQALSSWRGQKVDIMLGVGSAKSMAILEEPFGTAFALDWTLDHAGWLRTTAIGSGFHARGIDIVGISIEVLPEASANTRAAALELHSQLAKASLDVWMDTGFSPDPTSPWPKRDDASTIVVTIGTKLIP